METKIKVPSMLTAEYLYEACEGRSEDIAYSYYGKEVKVASMLKNIEIASKGYRKIGVETNSFVTTMVPDVPETIDTFFGVDLAGGTTNVISPFFTEEQIIKLINECESKIGVVFEGFLNNKKFSNVVNAFDKSSIEKRVYVSANRSLPIPLKLLKGLKDVSDINYAKKNGLYLPVVKNASNFDYSKLVREGIFNTENFEIECTDSKAFIRVYSSGSTGASKGITLSDYAGMAHVEMHKQLGMSFSKGEKFYKVIPSIFSTGVFASLLLPLCLGATVILEPKFDPEVFINNIIKYKPQYIIAPTTFWLALLDNPKLNDVDLSFMKLAIAGGEPLSNSLKDRMDDFFADHGFFGGLVPGYGMCEFGSSVTESASGLKRGSVGKLLPGIIGITVDPRTGEKLPAGKIGELAFKTPSRMIEGDGTFFDENGFGHTEDIGWIDEDDYVFVLGRKTAKVPDKYSAGIDSYFHTPLHRIEDDYEIKAAEVVGFPVENESKYVTTGFIVLHSDSKSSEIDVIKRAYDRLVDLDEIDIPKGIAVIEKFVPAASGKRDKNILRKTRSGFYRYIDGVMYQLVFGDDDKISYLKSELQPSNELDMPKVKIKK